MEYAIGNGVQIEYDIQLARKVCLDFEIGLPIATISAKTDLFRHNTLVSPSNETYQYIGQAPYGSEEDEAVWKVTRIIYDVVGKKVVSQVWNNQKWSDYKN